MIWVKIYLTLTLIWIARNKDEDGRKVRDTFSVLFQSKHKRQISKNYQIMFWWWQGWEDGRVGACQRPIKCWDAIFMQDPTNLPAPFLTSHVMFLPGLIISLYPDRNDFFKDPSTLQGLWKCDIPAKSHDSPSLSKWCFRKITLPPGVFCVWYLGVVLLLFAGDIELTKYEPVTLCW